MVLLTLMPAVVILSGLHDLTTMKIPNWLSILLVLAFYPIAWIIGLPLTEIAISTGIGSAALLVGMAMFALRWIGGGDAKLLAAGSLWMGFSGVVPFILMTAIAGGGLCLVLLVARAHLQIIVPSLPAWAARLLEPKGDIPYGVAIAAGALLAYPHSPMIQAFSPS